MDINLDLFEKQLLALNTPATEVLYGGAAGGGKALDVNTPIPTPYGYKPMGEIVVGDTVFAPDGSQVKVIAVTQVMNNRPCYEVEFNCGEKVVCDEQHLWSTKTVSDREKDYKRTSEYRAKRKRKLRGEGLRPDLVEANKARKYVYKGQTSYKAKTTKEIERSLKSRGRLNHSVIDVMPLQAERADLPIDPYVLGCWLGDGNSDGAGFTTVDNQIIEEIESAGYRVTKRSAEHAYGILGLQKQLRECGLLKNKHIPDVYLRASFKQRLALIQGLMDTDGTINKSCEFDNTNLLICEGLLELLRTCGIRTNINKGKAKLNGRVIGDKYRIKFVTTIPVFKLRRKLAKIPKKTRPLKRMIKSVNLVKSVPVKCIQVEGGEFLCGRSMVPTHNSHLMRIAAIVWCTAIAGLQVYLFRRVRDDLIKTHLESPNGFRSLLTPWVEQGWVKIKEDVIEFTFNGAKIYLCHCQHEKDVGKYLSAEFHVLLIDELTTFSEKMYRQLRARVRMVGIELPDQLKGQFPRILCGSNPGNVGHLFVKGTFVDNVEPLAIVQADPEEGGMMRQYIPARVNDNPALLEEDPNYVNKLRGLGSKALVDAMLKGDWNVVDGAYFDEFSTEKHVVRPFKVPEHWTRFASGDWGSAKPFSFGWWAVVTDDYQIEDGRVLPRGAIIRYKEWYGSKDHKDVGLKMDALDVGKGLKKRNISECTYGVLDPAAFNQDGGPSIAAEIYKGSGFVFKKADNTRVGKLGAGPGWNQVRRRLKGDGDGRPMIYFFSTCVDTIRTLPAMQHDENKPEDLNTNMEDHAVDEVRYACNSRPYVTELPAEERPIMQNNSFHNLVKRASNG